MALGLTGLAWAAGPEQPPVIHVVPLDAEVDARELAGPGVVVEPPPSPRSSPRADALLPVVERERLLKGVGLDQALAGWDELERDLLVQRARTQEPQALAAHYPGLPAAALQKLRQQLRARRTR